MRTKENNLQQEQCGSFSFEMRPHWGRGLCCPQAATAQASRKCTFAQLAEDTPVPNAACGRKTCGYTPQEGEKCE